VSAIERIALVVTEIRALKSLGKVMTLTGIPERLFLAYRDYKKSSF
jgi:hypothetical protein